MRDLETLTSGVGTVEGLECSLILQGSVTGGEGAEGRVRNWLNLNHRSTLQSILSGNPLVFLLGGFECLPTRFRVSPVKWKGPYVLTENTWGDPLCFEVLSYLYHFGIIFVTDSSHITRREVEGYRRWISLFPTSLRETRKGKEPHFPCLFVP